MVQVRDLQGTFNLGADLEVVLVGAWYQGCSSSVPSLQCKRGGQACVPIICRHIPLFPPYADASTGG